MQPLMECYPLVWLLEPRALCGCRVCVALLAHALSLLLHVLVVVCSCVYAYSVRVSQARGDNNSEPAASRSPLPAAAVERQQSIGTERRAVSYADL